MSYGRLEAEKIARANVAVSSMSPSLALATCPSHEKQRSIGFGFPKAFVADDPKMVNVGSVPRKKRVSNVLQTWGAQRARRRKLISSRSSAEWGAKRRAWLPSRRRFGPRRPLKPARESNVSRLCDGFSGRISRPAKAPREARWKTRRAPSTAGLGGRFGETRTSSVCPSVRTYTEQRSRQVKKMLRLPRTGLAGPHRNRAPHPTRPMVEGSAM
jgi:hypothetical protein